MKINTSKLEDFFIALEEKSNDEIADLMAKYLDAEATEIFADHIEEFYAVKDDDELAILAQIMVTGFLAGKEVS